MSVHHRESCGATTGGARVVDGDPVGWVGEPTWISGQSRFDRGELIYTDYPFDDSGTGSLEYPGEGDPLEERDDGVPRAGARLTRYGNNAADVVELRIAADHRYLYILARFNFLNAVDTTVLGIGIDLDGDELTGFSEWPHGAGLSSDGLDLFVTAFGGCALVDDGATSEPIDVVGGAAALDTASNTFEMALPRTLLNGAEMLRIVGGSGLWDAEANRWMRPLEGSSLNGNRSDDVTGGIGPDDPGVFNLLFRPLESTEDTGGPGRRGSSSGRTFQAAGQSAALRERTSGSYSLTFAIADLVERRTDPPMLRPADETAFVRTYRSAVDLEGVVITAAGVYYLSRHQPYRVILPDCLEGGCGSWPRGAPPLALLLHGGEHSHLGVGALNHTHAAERALANQYGMVVTAPLGRSRLGWYRGLSERDVLEVMNNTAAVYGTDADRQVVLGGSMGGYGAGRIASLYPDRFAGAFSHCPVDFEAVLTAIPEQPTVTVEGYVAEESQNIRLRPLMANLLNVPYRIASGTADYLAPVHVARRMRDNAIEAGLDLGYTEYHAGGHCNDPPEGPGDGSDRIGKTWLVNHTSELGELAVRGRSENPARVVYWLDPRHLRVDRIFIGAFDTRDVGISYDGAHWVSGVTLVPGVESHDSIVGFEATSFPMGKHDLGIERCPPRVGIGRDTGNPQLESSSPTPHSFECQAQVWSGVGVPALALRARGVATLAINAVRAQLPRTPVTFEIDTPTELRVTLLHRRTRQDIPRPDCILDVELGGLGTTITIAGGAETCTFTL